MLTLNGQSLTVDDVNAVAYGGEHVTIDDDCLKAVERAHERVQAWGADQRPMYGVNTGFGEMAHVAVPARYRTELQVNLLRGHAAGGGAPLPEPVVRAVMLARANSLAKGHSGVSVATLTLLVDLINHRVHPVIPEQGSLGASGDLSPLSHMALPLIGEGEVFHEGARRPSREVLDQLGLRPVELGFKEGLGLVNGTSAMTGAAALVIVEAYRLVNAEILLSSVLTQCLRGSTRAFDARGHELKGHRGQIAVAERLRDLLGGSELTRQHAELMSAIEEQRIDEVVDTGVYLQSAYSVRCVPQVIGPVLDTLQFVRGIVETELNSCNDNPLIFEEAEASFHGGNFHGQYVAAACDYLAIALTEVGVLAERQINRLVDPALNGELPDFLALSGSGLAIGMMGAQYLATSVASENLDLAAPSSVKSIPSNGQNQDIVSMGLNAARRCMRLVDNVSTILGVLGATCLQASAIVGPQRLSPSGREWYGALTGAVSPHREEAPIYQQLQASRDFHRTGAGAEIAMRLVGAF
ncbi:HAL/PAL/TAL family ammonia-lyase [Dactylosporangium sp. CA-139114]|uniref:HAL/PAL/TAL family ammonia-lyase n=1 Tax=Dactylosporangium sp. CA-139114 TaxID=3239931 RepID=UPI003D967680